MCSHLSAKHLTTTAYHLLANDPVEWYISTIVSQLRHNVASRQQDCVSFVQLLTYVYEAQVQCSTITTPFSLVLSRQTPGPTTVDNLFALPTNAYHETRPQGLRTHLLNQTPTLQSHVFNRLWTAQDQHERDYGAKICHVRAFPQEQMVSLDRPPLTVVSSKNAKQLARSSYNRLMTRTLGPFRIVIVTSHKLIIDENGIHKTVSIDRASTALNRL